MTLLLGVMVTCMCYLMTFEHVCSAFTLIRRHGRTKDSGQLLVNLSFFAIFNTYMSWTIPFYTQPARLRLRELNITTIFC